MGERITPGDMLLTLMLNSDNSVASGPTYVTEG